MILQELFRFMFYILLRFAEAGLQKVSQVGVTGTITPVNRLSLAYVAGLGFGIMSGAFSLVNVLADAYGPGTVGIQGDPTNFFVVSAFTSLAFVLLHTFWGVIFFESLDHKQYIRFSYVILSHLTVSYITLLNQRHLYGVSLALTYIILVISGLFAYVSAGGSLRKARPLPQQL